MDDNVLRQFERRVSALETRTAVDEVHRAAVEKRLAGIEDALRWLVRLIIGALVMAIIAFALRGGLAVV